MKTVEADERGSGLEALANPEATALIVEDEAILRDELRSALTQLWPELRIVGEAANGLDAVRLIDAVQPNVLFLDIQMPGMSGLDVAMHASGRCQIVFVTAYDEHAVLAFDHGAVDYLLKPLSMSRLATALRRVKQAIAAPPPDYRRLLQQLGVSAAPKSSLRWINASQGANVKLVTVDEVCYFQSDTKYTRMVTTESETLKDHQGTARRTRPRELLAGASRDHRQCRGDRRRVARPARPHGPEVEATPRDRARQPAVRTFVSADVDASSSR